MPLPFKRDPEPPKRSASADPFLEFESERPGVRLTSPAHEPLVRPEPDPVLRERLDFSRSEPTMGLGQPLRRSAISPAVAFAIGVAGLVTAAMAYYQLSQTLSSRNTQTPPTQTAATASAPAPSSPAPSPTPAAVTDAPAAPAAASTGTGRIDVASNPPGALVTLNGVARGVTPFILTSLPAGRHTIVVSRGSFSATRSVELEPGEATAVSVTIPLSVVRSTPAVEGPNVRTVPFSADAGPSGWVTFDLPVELQVFQGGILRGNTRDGRVMLPAGTHNVVLANTAYEYREVVTLTVPSGRGAPANVAVPTGSLSINALPWAEVWVDGKPMGATPLANLSLPIGPRDVLWKHPTLGDRRQVVVVKARTPVRVGVDFNR